MSKAPTAAATSSASQQTNLDERMRLIRELVDIFRVERIVYLSTTSVAVVILLVCAVVLLVRPGGNTLPVLIGLFGSSGIITYSIGRLLKMWDQAIEFLLHNASKVRS